MVAVTPPESSVSDAHDALVAGWLRIARRHADGSVKVTYCSPTERDRYRALYGERPPDSARRSTREATPDEVEAEIARRAAERAAEPWDAL